MTNIQGLIITWFELNKRDLPWRRDKNPYQIWVSEIILQQTQVVQGTPFYERFLGRFPTIYDLASAHEEDVLRIWQGLGYYSRARNMHQAAQQISTLFSGEFPKNENDISSLKGVGPYTTAAIGSIAFNLPLAAVDGNVNRVLSRLFAVKTAVDSSAGKKEIKFIADALLCKSNPGNFNQALMDFGAMVCTPHPKCQLCPLVQYCQAFQEKNTQLYPVKAIKIKKQRRFFIYTIYKQGNKVLMVKQTNKDIGKNLYEFPKQEFSTEQSWRQHCDDHSKVAQWSSGPMKHILTHRELFCEAFQLDPVDSTAEGVWVDLAEIFEWPTSKLIQNISCQFSKSI